VADLQPNQRKLSTGHHLSLYKVVDTLHISELIHQLGKVCRLRVLKKQSIIHHGQSTAEEIAELSDLSGSILELNNSASAALVRPGVNIILFGKLKKDLDSHINALFFGDSIQK
jgi:hypothetical protein